MSNTPRRLGELTNVGAKIQVVKRLICWILIDLYWIGAFLQMGWVFQQYGYGKQKNLILNSRAQLQVLDLI